MTAEEIATQILTILKRTGRQHSLTDLATAFGVSLAPHSAEHQRFLAALNLIPRCQIIRLRGEDGWIRARYPELPPVETIPPMTPAEALAIVVETLHSAQMEQDTDAVVLTISADRWTRFREALGLRA